MAMIGKGMLAGVGAVTISLAADATNREAMGANITHDAEAVPIYDGDKKVVGYVWNDDEGISMDIEYTPQASTFDLAKTAGGFPVPLSAVTIGGFPVVAVGGFSDAINSQAGFPWFYKGGGTITATGDSTVPFTYKITVIKRKQITGLTAIA